MSEEGGRHDATTAVGQDQLELEWTSAMGWAASPPTSATESASTSAISSARPRPSPGPTSERPMSREKIHSEHLRRRALVYVRQSTFDQVRLHHESRRRHYALQGHARTLGWTLVIGD
jgi:hypothetical protein